MQTRNRHAFTTIHTEGALLPADLLQRIRANDSNLDGLTPESYHLAPGEKLNEAVNRSWNRLTGIWGGFQHERGRLGQTDPGTGMTRDRWLLPLFQELGFGRLTISRAVEIEGKSYPISHHWENVPLHLVGCGLELDRRTPGVAGASRTSPHSLVQEYLNRADDAQWGVVSNGLNLRVLRDNAALTRQAYIEFDLESMFDGEIYSDFVLLWLIGHQSRFETYVPPTTSGTSGGRQQGGDCILERWSKSAQESGTRALDDLRRGVEEAIVSLGQGFMQHPQNKALVSRLKKGDLSAQDYYRQLLRLVYRLIFLFAAEDRDLLLLPGAPVEACQRYQNYYSTARLRSLAERQRGSRHHDRYEALRLVMTLLGSDQGSPELALPALGGFLFDPQSTADVNEAKLDNQSLLTAVRSLAFITESSTRRAVDYRNLGPEELGSVYESLLELHPLLNTDAGTFQLTSAAGNERKTTGSYYTPSSLIQVLLDSALDPVIEQALERAKNITTESTESTEKRKSSSASSASSAVQSSETALLALKVCDPACGSGHFLIAAAHRIAGRLAQVRASGDEPSPNEARRALRDVIRHCIYGVDINPMAVELCKVNLWLESLEPGKPLSFLDAHIKCGNSLVGVGPGVDITEIPDDAFNEVTGDVSRIARIIKGKNKAERNGQLTFSLTILKTQEELQGHIARQSRALEQLPENTPFDVNLKTTAYGRLQQQKEYLQRKLEYDLWTSAFFWNHGPEENVYFFAPTQEELRNVRQGNILSKPLEQKIKILSSELNFFHWELEFPEVFSSSTGLIKDFIPVDMRPRLSVADPTPMPVIPYITSEHINKVKALALQIADPHELLWQALAQNQLMNAPFERNAQVAGEIVDFYCPQAQVIVNLATGKEKREDAKKRERTLAKLKRMGVRVVTVWETSLRSVPEQELLKIANALADATFKPRIKDVVHSEGLFFGSLEPKAILIDPLLRKPGFDCVVGNPPWERIKLQEEEFFATRDPKIVGAPNKAAREILIKGLKKTNPSLARSFEEAKHAAECSSKFLRKSKRYPYSAAGDVNTYALFAEMARDLTAENGRAGIIVPTGIATDDTTKEFFGDLVEKRAIASLYDFENREAIFPGVHRSYKFCLLALSGNSIQQAQFVFFATRVEHLRDERRRFSLDLSEISLFNPNTRTMPIFRTRIDAELTRKIYLRVPVLVNERRGENVWGVNFLRMFDMSNDSGLFITEFREGYVGLYEAKMIHLFDHRWATYDTLAEIRNTEIHEKNSPTYYVKPRYWVSNSEVLARINGWRFRWALVFRGVGRATDERTSISSIVPLAGFGNSAPLIQTSISSPIFIACLLGCLDSLVFDYVVRLKVPGININFFILKQYPVLQPSCYTSADLNYLCRRILELVFTAFDLAPFAGDILNEIGIDQWNAWFSDSPLGAGQSPVPFPWDEDRRALLRAELDAYYAKLYGLTRDELRYILDPQDIYGPDFPGETFRVLKDKEIKQFGEYRTRRLVLEAWDRLEGVEVGNLVVYQAQSAIVPPKQETILVSQPKSESRPVAVQTQRPATAKPPLPVTAPSKVVKEIDPPAGQPTLTDFGLYKCEVCGKMVMGFEIEDHKNRMHSGDNINFNQIR